MNPGVDRHSTGTLPQAFAVSKIVCVTSGAVAAPLTTSTSGSTVAGLKKCMPTTRSGRARRPAIAVTDSDEVFVAMIVSGPTCDSICPSTRDLDVEVLDDDLDHETDVVELGVGVDRAQPREDRVALGGVETAALDPLVEAAPDLRHAAIERGRAGVAQVDRVAGAGGDLGDAAAHRAGADHDDGLVGGQRVARVSVISHRRAP